MGARFETVINKLIAIEGGYNNDPRDMGGETIGGVSRRFWPGWGGWSLVDEMKARGEEPVITPQIRGLLHRFYRNQFWDRMNCDSYPPAVAYELFDTAVNLGVGRTGELLQDGLNLLNRNGEEWEELVEDGKVGPLTMRTVRKALNQRNGERDLLKLLNALQAEHYLKLARKFPAQETYLRGWLNRT